MSLTALVAPFTFFLSSSSLGSEDLEGLILSWEETCCRVLLCSFLPDGCSRNCVKPYPFHPHERKYQRKALPGSKDVQYSMLHLNTFPLVLTMKTQIFNMAYKALCGLAPAFLSS